MVRGPLDGHAKMFWEHDTFASLSEKFLLYAPKIKYFSNCRVFICFSLLIDGLFCQVCNPHPIGLYYKFLISRKFMYTAQYQKLGVVTRIADI